MPLLLSVGLLIMLFFGFACGNSPSDQRGVTPKSENLSVDQVPYDRFGDRSASEAERFVPGQVMVQFTKGTEKQVIERIQQDLGLETVKVLSQPDLYLMKAKNDVSVEEIVKRLQHYEAVSYAEPNYKRTSQ
jgi:hypothetical protein